MGGDGRSRGASSASTSSASAAADITAAVALTAAVARGAGCGCGATGRGRDGARPVLVAAAADGDVAAVPAPAARLSLRRAFLTLRAGTLGGTLGVHTAARRRRNRPARDRPARSARKLWSRESDSPLSHSLSQRLGRRGRAPADQQLAACGSAQPPGALVAALARAEHVPLERRTEHVPLTIRTIAHGGAIAQDGARPRAQYDARARAQEDAPLARAAAAHRALPRQPSRRLPQPDPSAAGGDDPEGRRSERALFGAPVRPPPPACRRHRPDQRQAPF